MSVHELQAKWRELYNGEESRSRNRVYLAKRLCWRLQELALGGLSDRAKQRIEELAPNGFRRAQTPPMPTLSSAPPGESGEQQTRRRHRDVPSVGSVISKTYKRHELRVAVRDDGFEFEGTMYASLTAIAKHVTGSKNINGKLFFALVGRKR